MPGAAWTWPDALVAAVVAVCLATAFTRFTVSSRRWPTTGPAVSVALVVALAASLLTHGATLARIVVVAVAVVAVVAALGLRPPRRRSRNEIAPPDHRC